MWELKRIWKGEHNDVNSLRQIPNFLPEIMRQGQQDAEEFISILLENYFNHILTQNFQFIETNWYICLTCKRVSFNCIKYGMLQNYLD